MSATVFIPFNNQPVATQLKTASYTIAAGEYALARPLSPSCALNSVEVFLDILNPMIWQANATGSGSCHIPKNFTGKTVSSASATIKTVNALDCDNVVAPGASAFTPTTASGNVQTIYWKNGLPQGQTSPGSTAFLKFLEAFEIRISSNTATTWTFYAADLFPIWVTTGDVLDGGNWIVTRYNTIT